jgi:hypothetical protein
MMWLALTRLVPGIILLLISAIVENSGPSMLEFLSPRTMFILLLHVGLTGLIVNYL